MRKVSAPRIQERRGNGGLKKRRAASDTSFLITSSPKGSKTLGGGRLTISEESSPGKGKKTIGGGKKHLYPIPQEGKRLYDREGGEKRITGLQEKKGVAPLETSSFSPSRASILFRAAKEGEGTLAERRIALEYDSPGAATKRKGGRELIWPRGGGRRRKREEIEVRLVRRPHRRRGKGKPNWKHRDVAR